MFITGRHLLIYKLLLDPCMISFSITLSIQVSLCFISSFHIFAHLFCSEYSVNQMLVIRSCGDKILSCMAFCFTALLSLNKDTSVRPVNVCMCHSTWHQPQSLNLHHKHVSHRVHSLPLLTRFSSLSPHKVVICIGELEEVRSGVSLEEGKTEAEEAETET